MPEIKNIRDLLVVAMAPELGQFMADTGLRYGYPRRLTPEQAEDYTRQLVGFVLDHVTLHSLELLAKLRRDQGWTE